MSGEKKRLEQYLLQTRASNIMLVNPVLRSQVNRFEPPDINRMRLLEAQRMAGMVPVSETLKKQQKKRKKKSRKTKNLRGDLARNLTEQRRFTRGERREKDTEEPRIVGDPAPVPAGFAYDPVIERRRLDIEEARDRQRQLERIADRREQARRQDAELAVRRGELAAGRADRALIRAAPPAPPIVIPPAAAPVINIAPAPVRVDVAAPVVNVPAPVLPARADADPIPEIRRLGAEIRADTNAFGQEQDARNRLAFRQIREGSELENRQLRQTLESIEARQQSQDENRRADIARQDALNEELQARMGLGEVSMGQARDAVIQEIRDAEDRLRRADRELDRPTGFDDVILAADREARALQVEQPLRVPIEEIEELDSPTPELRLSPASVASPTQPTGIGGTIAGGGELELPAIVVDEPGSIEAEPPTPSTQSPLDQIPTERLRRGGGSGAQQFSGSDTSESSISDLETSADAQRLDLDPVQPVNVAETLRLSRLAIDEAEPVLQEEEADETQQERLRLVDTQDFLSGFDRPVSPQADSPSTRSQRAARNLPVREEAIESPEAIGSPRPQAETPSTPEEESLLRDAYDESEEEAVEFLPGQDVASYVSPRLGGGGTPGQVAEGIAQFGGASEPAPPRVIEDAGIQAQPELRPLDPDVLFEPLEEAEVVGQVQDQRPQAIRDSSTLFTSAIPELGAGVRTGPRGARSRGGVGYRVRNNTDRTLKKIQPGDVVNITGVEEGTDGQGRFRLDTETATGTRVGMGQFAPLIDDGSLLFERGHRHELGGHYDEQPYGPPPEQPGLLQQGAEAVGGAAAGVVGGAARLAGGAALGVGQGLYDQLPAAGDVGAALGRGAVAGVAGAGRLAAGAVGAVVGGGEEEEEEEEP